MTAVKNIKIFTHIQNLFASECFLEQEVSQNNFPDVSQSQYNPNNCYLSFYNNISLK